MWFDSYVQTGVSVQTDEDYDFMAAVKDELQDLRKETSELEEKVKTLQIKFDKDYFRDNNEKSKTLDWLTIILSIAFIVWFP